MGNILTPEEIDKKIGKRLRLRRALRGQSMEDIAKQVGVALQQIQKYEVGKNRISVSRLFLLAKALDIKMDYFFEDLEITSDGVVDTGYNLHDGFSNKDIVKLINSYTGIKNPKTRRKAMNLIGSLSDE